MNTKLIIGALAMAGALALSAGSSFAAPPQPNFSLQLNLGNGGPYPYPHHDDHPHFDRCLSPRDIMGDLADQGFSRFVPVDRSRHSFTIDARRHFRWYELEVDSCSGDIINMDRIDHP